MPANRENPVMDNPYYDWSPISTRPRLRWPNGARVAIAVIVNLEYMELEPPPGITVPPSRVRAGGIYPNMIDIHETTAHEYGNRVGVFRVMKVLDKHRIPGTAALDAAVAQRYAYIVQQAKQRNWEFIGHSLVYNRMITEKMQEPDEQKYIKESLEAVTKATGKPVHGWVGVDYGESSRTVRLLAEQGVHYVCDWCNDEQPYRMKVPQGHMVSLPTLLELDDIFTHRTRRIPIQRWAQMIKDAFDKLYHDGQENGRMLVLNVHPWIIGHPFRINALDDALSHIMRHQGVWPATCSEIVDWYLKQTTLAAEGGS